MFPILYFFSDWAILVLRLVFGFLMAAHGLPKLKNLKGTAEWMESEGFRPGRLWATAVAVLEFFGGIAIFFGFFTQPVAVIFVLQFAVIVLWKIGKSEKLVGSLELDLLVLSISLLLATIATDAPALDSFFYGAGY
ncbi:DoxX family protein [Candidatus Parcubacteria bacterium]|nr:MAG: DoxX family protein [Candidatus Parcubacteria bacterium]